MSSLFSSKSKKTFLVEAGNSRFRIDLNLIGDRFVVDRIVQGEAEGPDTYARSPSDPSWLTRLLKTGPRPAREVTLLTSRAFAVMAEIPELASGEIRSALEMEAQTVTGLAANAAQLSHMMLPSEPGDLKCWVVQAPRAELLGYRAAVAAARCRLVSVGHPSGIPLETGECQVECWPDFVLIHTGAHHEFRGWSGTLAHREAFDDTEVAALLGQGEGMLLAGTGIVDMPSQFSAGIDVVRMDDNEGMARWSAALAELVDPLGVPTFPTISLPKPPRSNAALGSIAAVIVAGVILFSVGHHLLDKRTHQILKDDLQELSAPLEALAAERTQISKLNVRIRQLEEEAQGVTEANGIDPAEHRQRMGALLAGISRSANSRAVVLKVFPGKDASVIIEGVATTPEEPQKLAGRLDAELASTGWRAQLVRRIAKLLQAGGGPWTFEIQLTPEHPSTAPQGASSRSRAEEGGRS